MREFNSNGLRCMTVSVFVRFVFFHRFAVVCCFVLLLLVDSPKGAQSAPGFSPR
jgi:hypothetical protein